MCRRTEEVVGPMIGLKGRNIVCCQTKEKQNKWGFFFGLATDYIPAFGRAPKVIDIS